MANLNLIKDIGNPQKIKGIQRKGWSIEERERESVCVCVFYIKKF